MDNKVGSSRLGHFVAIGYFVADVNLSIDIPFHGAVGYHFADCDLCVSSGSAQVLSGLLRCSIQNHELCHLICLYAPAYAFACVAYYCLVLVDTMQGDSEEHLLFHRVDSERDIPTRIVRTLSTTTRGTSIRGVCYHGIRFHESFLLIVVYCTMKKRC